MQELKNKLGDYIAGRVSLEEFEDGFVSLLLDEESKKDSILYQGVYDIELKLAEYSNGYWTENELKEHLHSLLSRNGWIRKKCG